MLSDTAIVLDFETTGLDADEGHRVTEIAALRVRGDRVVGRFESLVNSGARIPGYIAKFTGITQTMIDNAPDAARVFRQLLAFIGTDKVIAHNAWFDEGFLARECERLGLPNSVPEFVCSVRIARRLFPELKSHALGSLASRLGMPFMPGAHCAGVDASVTASIVLRMCELLRARLATPGVDVATLHRFATSADVDPIATAA